MKKFSKFLACSLTVTQLSFPLSSVFATSEKSENIKNQENTVLKYAKKAAVLPLKGAWWLTKAPS